MVTTVCVFARLLTHFNTGHLRHAVKTGVAATTIPITDALSRNSANLLREISAAFHRLADPIAVPRSAFASTDLERAVSAVDDKAAAIRTSGISMGYSLEEVARFYAFFISVKSLVKALQGDYGNDPNKRPFPQNYAPPRRDRT